MKIIDKYYIAPISVYEKREYFGNSGAFKLYTPIIKYACVSIIYDRKEKYYIDLLSKEIYRSNIRYFDSRGTNFIDSCNNMIALNQIVNKDKMSKRKLKKVVRIALVEINKQFLSEKEINIVENIQNDIEGKTKKLECGRNVIRYKEEE